MTLARILDLYNRGIMTWKEAFDALVEHVANLLRSGHISTSEAAACEKQVVRWYDGEISSLTLERYVGMII